MEGVITVWRTAYREFGRYSWSIRQLFRWLERRIGRAGLLRIVLLSALLLSGGLLIERCQELESLGSEAVFEAPVRETEPGQLVPSTARFNGSSANDVPLLFGAFQQVAQEQGLRLDRLEYQREPTSAEVVEGLRVSMTIMGHADKIHAWVLHFMRAYPGLALLRLKYARERIEVPEIEAQLTWVFYFKPREPGKAKP